MERYVAVAVLDIKRPNSAEAFCDFAALSSNQPELLRRNRAGQNSIRINAQWHIWFPWGSSLTRSLFVEKNLTNVAVCQLTFANSPRVGSL